MIQELRQRETVIVGKSVIERVRHARAAHVLRMRAIAHLRQLYDRAVLRRSENVTPERFGSLAPAFSRGVHGTSMMQSLDRTLPWISGPRAAFRIYLWNLVRSVSPPAGDQCLLWGTCNDPARELRLDRYRLRTTLPRANLWILAYAIVDSGFSRMTRVASCRGLCWSISCFAQAEAMLARALRTNLLSRWLVSRSLGCVLSDRRSTQRY